MNAASKLQDVIIGHAIEVSRYAKGLSNDIVRLLNSADRDIVERIAARTATIDRRGYDPGPRSTQRLNTMLDEVRALNGAVYSKVGKTLTERLVDFAAAGFTFFSRSLEDAVPIEISASVPPPSFLKAIVEERPFQGVLLRDWVSGAETARMDRLTQQVQIGLVESETVDQIVKRVRGTAAMGFADGVLNISRNSAQALTITAVNHVATQAREETYAANSDLISGVRWVSTLDGRTSPICRARDGKIFPLNSGPRPPSHIRCRSTTVPMLRSWREIGIPADEASPGIRAALDGAVPADTTYGQWLKGRNAAFQDDVLGKAKGAAFRNGLPIDGFVDASGKEYNLDQLKAQYPQYF